MTLPFSIRQTVGRRRPERHGQLPVFHEMAVLAVNRDEIAGLDHVYEYLQLFLIGVPGDMDVFDLLVDYIRPVPAQVVYDVLNGALVSGNEPRGKDYRIPFLDS